MIKVSKKNFFYLINLKDTSVRRVEIYPHEKKRKLDIRKLEKKNGITVQILKVLSEIVKLVTFKDL